MSSTPHTPFHRERLKKFIHPLSGKHVYVANSPEEVASLKRKLSAAGNPSEEFDIYIHGSEEHVNALRESHSRHEQRREELRQEHSNVYDEFESVRSELDTLSAELHHITEHGVSLDANFSKYGYSAHLRTHDTPTGASSPHDGSHDHEHHHDWEAERSNVQSIPLFKKPVVRQYFHQGLLWRASETEEVASFELFFDLLYVGLIAVMGDTAAEDPTGESLLKFAIAFILSWKIWSDLALMISYFETDDVIQRISVLFIMACLFGFTTNVVESGDQTYNQMIGFYLATRFFSATYYVLLYFYIPMLRAYVVTSLVAVLIPCSLWIGSIYVAQPNRQGLIWVAIILDLFAGNMAIVLVRSLKNVAPGISKRLGTVFDFYPGINIEHKTSRTDAFVSLVLGYSVVSVLYQNTAHLGLNGFFGKAVLTLVQSFSLNWLYFEIDGANLFQHAIRRHFVSSIVWNFSHLPFILTLVLAAASASRLVLAHDIPSTPLSSLTPPFADNSPESISPGIRWFYCAGLAITLASMGVISFSHLHRSVERVRLSKNVRLGVRGVVCLVILLLPLAGDRLNSIDLIAITSSMIAGLVGLEVWGVGRKGESMLGRKGGACKYQAMLGKGTEKEGETGYGTVDSGLRRSSSVADGGGKGRTNSMAVAVAEKKSDATVIA